MRVARLPLLLLTGAAACASTRPIAPLSRGETVLAASVGGPLVQVFDATLPGPILTVAGARGVGERLAASGAFDVTAAVYGTLHVEPGVAYYPVVHEEGPVPSVMLAASLHALTNFEDALVAPA